MDCLPIKDENEEKIVYDYDEKSTTNSTNENYEINEKKSF